MRRSRPSPGLSCGTPPPFSRETRTSSARFNPLYPTVYAALPQYGLPTLINSLTYLHSLRTRYRFVVVNCENVHVWGGTASDWTNARHIDQLNMRRMLRYAVAHSDGALR